MRYETTTAILRRLSDLKVEDVIQTCLELSEQASKVLEQQGINRAIQASTWEADLRYRGQGLTLAVPFSVDEMKADGFKILEER